MFRMSFDQGWVGNIEEYSLFEFMRAHVLGLGAQLVLMHMCTLLCVRICVFQFIWKHNPTHIRICRPVCTCWHLKSLIFIILSHFSPISLSSYDFHAILSSFLQILPPFSGRGSTNHIASWYKAITDNMRALVRAMGFEPILCLLLESHASTILVQSLAERWWETTHTFHIADREMTVTPHDFHQMTNLRCDRSIINLKGESGVQLVIDLLGRRNMTDVIHYYDIEMDYKPLPQVTPNDCAWMAKAFLLYILGRGGATQWLGGGGGVALAKKQKKKKNSIRVCRKNIGAPSILDCQAPHTHFSTIVPGPDLVLGLLYSK